MNNQASIFEEDATILQQSDLGAGQFLLRLNSPRCATAALPGNFIHLECGESYTLRRPFSIMRTDPKSGWIEVLYKIVGVGTRRLSEMPVNTRLASLGPIGNAFSITSMQAKPILIGGGVGIPPVVFFAEQLKKQHDITPLVILGSEIPFPFKMQPSQYMIEGLPNSTIAAMTLLEDLQIPSRLASKQGYQGCFDGYVHEVADLYLRKQDETKDYEIFACGPEPMLRAVAEMSQQHQVTCQLSLEEYMACAVGGCAGCAVEIYSDGNKKMKRVCVDGPIFSAEEVYPLGT